MAAAPASPHRYPSDLTDAQWALIEPLLPPHPGVGRVEKHPRRELVNAILYVLRTGCAWRQLPRDYPPWQTVYWHFRRWNADGTLDFVHDELRARVRAAEGREPGASRASSTPSRSRARTPSGRPPAGSMRARRSTGASAT